MKTIKLTLVSVLLAASLPALAAAKTVTLAVPSMDCAICPITVKKALKAVPGVLKVNVSFAKKDAVVTYDDARTNVGALTKATANAGYPSKPE
ncbi:MAG: mercury resistance system periplasmic binding protein MerP [Acidobacteriaceae bacterium]